MHLRGEAVKQDEDAAIELLEQAAAQGHESAELTIGRLHLAHANDPARVALAAKLFQRLAEDGSADAQVALGLIYTFGQGVEQDYEEGRFWLTLASNQGSGTAQLNLGNLYVEGVGVERDRMRAYAWYAISADNGDPAGKLNRDLLAQELNEIELTEARQLAIQLASPMPTSNTERDLQRP